MENNEVELSKEYLKLKKDFEIEVANIKINYIGSLIVVVAYLFFDKMGGISLFGINLSIMTSTIITAVLITLFLLKESILYSKYISKKIIFKVN